MKVWTPLFVLIAVLSCALPVRAKDDDDDQKPVTQPGGATSQPVPAVAAAGSLTPEIKDAKDEILMVYMHKCAECHAVKPKKAKLNFGTDLNRMVANPKLIVPFKLDDSGLYSSVDADDMPPEKAPPLTKAEKGLMLGGLKKWILAGAPAGGPTTAAVAAPDETDKRTFSQHLTTLIGKFHPLLAHFPIALLVSAGLAELLWLRFRQTWLTGVVRFCTLFGALGACVAAGLGWFDAMRHTAGTDLEIHRWLGTAAAVWALPVLLLSERAFSRGRENPVVGDPKPWFQIMLFTGIVLVSLAAHFGGDLVYGADYLTW